MATLCEGERMTIRRLVRDDAPALVVLRRTALEESPFAFVASPQDDGLCSPEGAVVRLEDPMRVVLGAVHTALVGMIGLHRNAKRKKHISGGSMCCPPGAGAVSVGRCYPPQ